MARKKTKTALEIISDIGSPAYDLQFYGPVEIQRAMEFMRQANPQMFAWLSTVLAEPKAADEWKVAVKLIQRRLVRDALGDCQAFWDYDATEFLKRIGAPPSADAVDPHAEASDQ